MTYFTLKPFYCHVDKILVECISLLYLPSGPGEKLGINNLSLLLLQRGWLYMSIE